MRKTIPLTTLFTLLSFFIIAQQKTDSTIKELNEVIIKAFEQNRKLMDVPAAVTVISQKQLVRFSNTSLVPALNAAPGVRMEERSPGSYRLNIRGSSLRSPFGVRNVKVYLNDIPFTEPGGSTYLNLLSFYNIQSLEILKGPSSSLYGGGTGGAVLLKTDGTNLPSGAGIDYSFGSFGLQNINLLARIGEGNTQQTIGYNKIQNDGYRSWTKLRREVFSWNAHLTVNQKQTIHTFLLYADLAYQTPGGLTPAEFAANPKQARPAAGTFPSSATSHASVNQKTFFAGISHEFAITENFKNTTSLYGAFSQFANPTVRNFERRSEPHAGGRSLFSFQPKIGLGELKIIAGAELQRGWYNIRVYKNKSGVSDSLQTEDEVNPFTWNSFAQVDWQLPQGWLITAGASVNQNTIEIIRLNKFPIKPQKRTYANEIAPRISLLKNIAKEISVYASAAKGFSPPTSAEVLPSTGVITTGLNAEEGWNYETGVRINWKEKLFVDLNTFFFNLNNTIVQRRDASGADYFTNAGSTKQRGVESFIHYKITDDKNKVLSQSKVWLSYTYNNFRYKEFKQISNDYSGKQLPSVPKNMIAIGFDAMIKCGAYINITYNYNDKTPLNDANTFYADDYHLLAIRLGYKKIFIGKLQAEVFAGADNLFNETYSLGNDINAAANRFYNIAPGRNYYAGISLFQRCRKK